MTTLFWKERTNIENSLFEFLESQLSGLTVFYKGEQKTIDLKIGFSPDDSWNLPVISLYHDSRTALRGFVGQNKRLKEHLIIIDIRGLTDRMRQDIADWVGDTINDGFDYYTYTRNTSNPQSPNKTLSGKVAIEFITDNKLRFDENVDEFDRFRHNISINATIAV